MLQEVIKCTGLYNWFSQSIFTTQHTGVTMVTLGIVWYEYKHDDEKGNDDNIILKLLKISATPV